MSNSNSRKHNLNSLDLRRSQNQSDNLKKNNSNKLHPLSRSIGESKEMINIPIIAEATNSQYFYSAKGLPRKTNYIDLLISQSQKIPDSEYSKYFNFQNYLSGTRLLSPTKNNREKKSNYILNFNRFSNSKSINNASPKNNEFISLSSRKIQQNNLMQANSPNLTKSIFFSPNTIKKSTPDLKFVDNIVDNQEIKSVNSLIELRNNILHKYYNTNSKEQNKINENNENNLYLQYSMRNLHSQTDNNENIENSESYLNNIHKNDNINKFPILNDESRLRLENNLHNVEKNEEIKIVDNYENAKFITDDLDDLDYKNPLSSNERNEQCNFIKIFENEQVTKNINANQINTPDNNCNVIGYSYESLFDKLRRYNNDNNIILRSSIQNQGTLEHSPLILSQKNRNLNPQFSSQIIPNFQIKKNHEDKKSFVQFSDIIERNKTWEKIRENKYKEMRLRYQDKDLEGCTFKPFLQRRNIGTSKQKFISHLPNDLKLIRNSDSYSIIGLLKSPSLTFYQKNSSIKNSNRLNAK